MSQLQELRNALEVRNREIASLTGHIRRVELANSNLALRLHEFQEVASHGCTVKPLRGTPNTVGIEVGE